MFKQMKTWLVLATGLMLSSCGGGKVAEGLDLQSREPRDFSLRVLEESYFNNSSAQFRLEVIEDSDSITASIHVEDALDLRAAYVELSYDPRFYAPRDVDAAGILAPAEQLLSLSVSEVPGLVAYGELLINPDESPGYSGSGLLATVQFTRSPFAESRSVKDAPDDNLSKTTLEFIDASSTFWYYYSTGDYDQNGETNIADLTPLGRHFGKTGPFAESSVLSVIDYDSNQVINISDITGIGIGYGSTVKQYNFFESLNHEADYPASNGEPAKLAPQDTIPFGTGKGDKSLDRLSFGLNLVETVPGAGYWVRPADDDGDGTPSNKVTFDDIPDFALRLFQVDHTLDDDVQVFSEFGQVELEFTGKPDPEYFNLVVNGDWVIENVPVLPVSGVGELQTVVMDFPLGNEPGTQVTSVTAGASLSSEVKTEAPKENLDLGILTAIVQIFNGQDALSALTSGEVLKEHGTEVDGDNWAVHGTAFPNQEAAKNECVPAAVANSLKFLKDSNATEMGGVADADIGSTSVGGAMGYTPEGGTPGSADGKATWPGKKDKYLKDKGVPVSTTAVPAVQSFSGEATAADCDTALQAIKDGKDVELQGRSHCAAIVGMAKLKNGKYVIYVAHDTNQGNAGGQKVQKIIYDPSAASPVAEGGSGFNGRNIFGFVIEAVDTKKQGDASYFQDDYSIDDFALANSAHGQLEFTYEQTADPLLFLNVSIEGEHQIFDLPLRSGEAGEVSTVFIPIYFAGNDGDDVINVTAGHTLDPLGGGLQPSENLLLEVGDTEFNVDSGEDGAPLQYTGVTTDPTWFLGHNFTDAAFHPSSVIVNQECGNNECAPAAISNSLKTLQKLNPTQNQGLDVGIGTIKGACGWTAGGSPAGTPDNAGAWWNLKKKWMNDRPGYPVQTDIVSDKSKFDDIIKAIRAGKDVELRVPGHVVMVTGIIKLANGEYILEIAHDSDQTDNAKGTQTELIKYDPVTNTFSGRGWINGKKFTDGGSNGCLFVVESFSNLNILRTNITVDDTVIDLSGFGEVNFTFEAKDEVQYFNLVIDDEWKIQNLPVPSLAAPGVEEKRTMRFPFTDLLPGEELEEIPYSFEFGDTPLVNPPALPESSIIDPGTFTVGTGESGFPLLSPFGAIAIINWLAGGIVDIACHDGANVVNQEAGDNECAPAAISNSLKLLQNQHAGMAGLGTDISDTKPATGWTPGGAPAGDPEDAGAWWNLKAQYMIDNGYPVTTEIKTKDDFGEIVDDIKAGKDVEMRVPGHVVMVVCVVVLANGDMIFWVAHDTDQDDPNGGTTIEPIYYDASEGTFHGSFWVEGKSAATPGNAGVLFVVEDYIDLSLLLPLCIDPFSLIPPGLPGAIPDGHSGTAQLLHRDTLQPMGTIPFLFFDPGGNHMSWQPGPSGHPLIVFDNLTGAQQLGVQFFGEGAQLDFPGYEPALSGVELLLYNAFGGLGDQPAGTGQITLADFTPQGQFQLGPSQAPPLSPPNSFGVTLGLPTPPNDFFFGTFQQPATLLELDAVYMDMLAIQVPN
jgi:hypothetical protein